MLKCRFAWILTCLLWCGWASTGWCQLTGGGATGTGAGGGRGTTGAGVGGGGAGGFGAGAGAAQIGQGQTALQQQGFSLTGNNDLLNSQRDASQFVGRNENVGFIGAAEGGNVRGGQRTRGTQANQDRNVNDRGGGTARRRINYRTKITLGFRRSPPQTTAISQSLERLFGRAFDSSQPIAVSLEGTTATLTGVVETEEQRSLAAQLTRLEPAVGEVRNQITVSPNSP